MDKFCGGSKQRSYFEGWYLKQQSDSETLALIPAFHIDAEGRPSASLQVITGEGSCRIEYAAADFQGKRDKFDVRLGGSRFTAKGCRIDCCADGIEIYGSLRYGPFLRPRYDIMGPFQFVPFLQCRHSVFSLRHRVDGALSVNGREYRFERDLGYMEGDRGSSFPNRYLWTQCIRGEESVMLSVANIPFGPLSFTGCIGCAAVEGREYRIATYLGAKPVKITPEEIVVRQGELTFSVRLIRENSRPLRAPVAGGMSRTIHESAACTAAYRLERNGHPILDFVSDQASFENAWESDRLC